MISIKIRDIFDLAPICIKVTFSVAHWNQSVVDGVKEEAGDRALWCILHWVQSVEVEAIIDSTD